VAAICFVPAATLPQHDQFALARAGAAVQGVAGLLFGLAATCAKPVINDLHDGFVAAAEDWRTWALVGFGCAAAALLAALGGAVPITPANRETPMPGQATGADGTRTDGALA